MNMKRDDIYNLISMERVRQIEKWGKCPQRVENPASSNNWKTAVLGEEFGELSKAVVENKQSDIRDELIHVAAVAVAWLESL